MDNLLDFLMVQKLIERGEAYYDEQGRLVLRGRTLTADEFNELIRAEAGSLIDAPDKNDRSDNAQP